jgi:CubicO group peptidase (beta-lactamase class C family)
VLNLYIYVQVVSHATQSISALTRFGFLEQKGERLFGYIHINFYFLDMKRHILLLLSLITCLYSSAQSPDFTDVDDLLSSNGWRFSNNVCVIVEHNDSIWYINESGLDTIDAISIMSDSKWLSAATILALQDEGLLDIDDTIGEYLPIFTANGKGDATIRQCFSHTAGYPFSSSYELNSGITMAEAVDSIALYVQPVPAGTQFSYGQVSMQIVGRIAEVVTGLEWEQVFQSRIASKCGMASTTYTTTSAHNSMIGGGAYSTAADFMRFVKMVQHNGMYNGMQVLSEEGIAEFYKDQTHMAPVDYTPYPIDPVFHPYHVDTVRYGFGDWLDVYNPTTDSVEQIGSNGAFGSVAWLDKCRNIRGVSFTSSVLPLVHDTQLELMDMFRRELAGCGADTTVGLPVFNDGTFKVYPNPALDRVVVQASEPLVFRLYSLTGRNVMEVAVSGKQTIDIASLANGMYLYEVKTQTILRREKLIIAR